MTGDYLAYVLELVEFFDNAIFIMPSKLSIHLLELVEFFDNAIFILLSLEFKFGWSL